MMSLRALLLLFLLLCVAIGREHALASSEDLLEEDAVEPGEEEEEEEDDMFDTILKQVEVTSMAGPTECQHAAELGDRVYLEYAGIEHATGEVFSANTRLGQMALIVRIGERQVLPGKLCCHDLQHTRHFYLA